MRFIPSKWVEDKMTKEKEIGFIYVLIGNLYKELWYCETKNDTKKIEIYHKYIQDKKNYLHSLELS